MEAYSSNRSMANSLNTNVEALPDLPDDHELFYSVAEALAHLCVNVCLLVSPEKIVLGGGVMNRTVLYEKIRIRFKALMNNYLTSPKLEDNYIVRPGLEEN